MTDTNKALEKHGLRHIRLHDLKHSCASLLVDRGWQMKDISEWLGHSGIGITMDLYAHLYTDRKRKLADGLSGIFNK